MKRAVLVLLLGLAATAAFAFDPERREPRIAVVSSPGAADGGSSLVARLVREELRGAGLDAYTIDATVDELVRDGAREEADLVVELVSLGARTDHHGGIGIPIGDAHLGLGVVNSTVATELRVYEVVSGELLLSRELVSRRGALLPTGLGAGGRHFFGWIALPIGEMTQPRRAARAVARDASALVLETV
ncbi:MAG: hypothetical protein WA208_10550, partial [Thermoanaerobaculia bacterium]